MVERERLIYWKVIYGHRNGSDKVQGFFEVPGGYRNPPGKLMGLMGHSGGEEAGHGRWRAPPLPNPNWTRGGGATPLFPSPSLVFPLSPSLLEGKGGAD